MLAEGGDGIHPGLGAGESDGRQQRADVADRGRDLAPPVASGEHRMLQKLADCVDPGVGDPGLVEQPNGAGGVQLGEAADEEGVELVPMGHPSCVRAEPLVGSQLGALQKDLAEAGPLGLVLDSHHDGVPVAGGVGTVGGNRGVLGAGASGLTARPGGELGGLTHPLGERLEQRDLHRGALPGDLALVQRGEGATEPVHARGDVGDGDADLRRRFG